LKSTEQLKSLETALENDTRPEIAWLLETESFKLRCYSAAKASKEEQIQLIADLDKLLADRKFDRESYGLATGLARAIGYSNNSELAATVYEDLAKSMSESDDKLLQARAGKMVGAARRMRLPGKFMEISGTTTEGKEFDWDAYRGKVVLVDFWASWSAPCRREVPNMKRNLAAYGKRGFEIVGINLDLTLTACEKYAEKEQLSWTNLMSHKDGERGWANPLATHYGISATPTAILVDQEGKVVSLAARGKELGRLLGEILGAAEPSQEAADSSVAEELDESDA
jgi:thiol-disulfide isomerase/thioredoxin